MWKIREDSRNKREMEQLTGGAPAPTSWVVAQARWPIMFHLVDYASTTFEDE
jgi:hypothetical protein